MPINSHTHVVYTLWQITHRSLSLSPHSHAHTHTHTTHTHTHSLTHTHTAEDGQLMAAVPKVRLVRLEERSGLIRARVRGTREARGPVLTFLDSHCEVTTGWLQPLLSRIQSVSVCVCVCVCVTVLPYTSSNAMECQLSFKE